MTDDLIVYMVLGPIQQDNGVAPPVRSVPVQLLTQFGEIQRHERRICVHLSETHVDIALSIKRCYHRDPKYYRMQLL